mmetsp:Transcript_19024/g.32272  ORF Transcript_19024/g.32272 Transcript_19024/m.32272 type:complete len:120 (-) Transcript_19024:731-1090(-)
MLTLLLLQEKVSLYQPTPGTTMHTHSEAAGSTKSPNSSSSPAMFTPTPVVPAPADAAAGETDSGALVDDKVSPKKAPSTSPPSGNGSVGKFAVLSPPLLLPQSLPTVFRNNQPTRSHTK